jgi:Uma2 family endonuclease
LEQFYLLNDDIQIERRKDGVVDLNPPVGGFTGSANAAITYQLRKWWHTHHRGIAVGSSVGFFLPDGSMLSPDAAYVLPEQCEGLTATQRAGFPHYCPAFVIELLPAADKLVWTQEKMWLWIANGAHLGWLVDPYQQKVFVYEPGSETHVVEHTAHGSGLVAGFALDLSEVWNCYET